MSELARLINQKVTAEIEVNDQIFYVDGIVLDININDFYFYEKNEPIYITVSIMPTEEVPEEIDSEELSEIPLSNIRKSY